MFINGGPELLTVTGSLKLDQNMSTSASIYQHENRQRFQIPDFFFPLNIPISLVFFRHYPHFFFEFELCDSWGGGHIFWVFIKKVPLHDAIYKKYCNVIELLKYKISTSSNVHRLKKKLIILIKFCYMLLRFGPTLFSDWIA